MDYIFTELSILIKHKKEIKVMYLKCFQVNLIKTSTPVQWSAILVVLTQKAH